MKRPPDNMRQNGEGRHNTQTHKTLQRPYSAPIPCTQDGYHGHWLPAISPVLCVSNSARKPNRNLGCGYDTALGGMEEPGGLKRPIYLFQLQQRATLFPFQLFKPTGSGLLSPAASHRPNSRLVSRTAQLKTLSAHQLSGMETSIDRCLALFFSKTLNQHTRPRNLKSREARNQITIQPARSSITAEDRPSQQQNETNSMERKHQSRT